MKEIKLSKQGKNKGKFVALVDNEDYEYLNQFNWYVWLSRSIYYASRHIMINGKRKTIHLHRKIMCTPDYMFVDHIDHNGLNCQKYNMRNCNRSENSANRRSSGRSKYLGVYYSRRGNYEYIRAQINGIHLGMFKTEEEAAKCYDYHAKELFGEFANLNFK